MEKVRFLWFYIIGADTAQFTCHSDSGGFVRRIEDEDGGVCHCKYNDLDGDTRSSGIFRHGFTWSGRCSVSEWIFELKKGLDGPF